MAGGLLNLVTGGTQNAIMYGNPQKTYWTSTYKQITNFGLQNFRVDYEGLRQLQVSSDTVYTFKIKRYAELLTQTYFVIQLPDIYSPVYVDGSTYHPYEFNWIKNIGAMMIRTIRFTIGGSLIQQMSGYDIVALANRDLSTPQKEKWDEMVGNIPELYDPVKNSGFYPNVIYTSDVNGAEPSIRGRQIRVPLPIWWGLNSQQAFPLVCLQYNEIQIEVTLRPIQELFQIRDITNTTGNSASIIAPNMVLSEHQFYRFLQTPPETSYTNTSTSWNENTHLSCTYGFLSEEEAVVFATKQQSYLIRELYDTRFYNVSTTDKVWLQNSTGLVLNWMILFQRSDVDDRNEWSNFTNWAYDYLPFNITQYPDYYDMSGNPIYITGNYAPENQKDILVNLGISFDGSVREETRAATVYKYEHQFLAVPGKGFSSLDGLYCYNFCLNTSPFNLQPSGAANLCKYSKIELEFSTITPALNPNYNQLIICDPLLGGQIGVSKPISNMYEYNFDLFVIEERYNMLTFVGGNASLMSAR